MWWKFKRHRLAVVAGIFLVILYGTIPISEFLAPYDGGTPQHRLHPRAAAAHPPVP